MSRDTFQVIAATPQRSREEVAELAERLGDLFDVELSELLDALSRTGVCVTTAASLREARAKGAKIISVGADYRVLDERGKQLDAGEAKGRVSVTPRPTARSSRTIMGMGSHLIGMATEKPELEDAGGFAGTESRVAEGAMDVGGKEDEIELEDSGGFAALDSSIAEGAVDLGDASAREIQLDDTGGFAAADTSIAQGAVELGASEQKLELEDTSGGFAVAQHQQSAPAGIAVPAGPDKVELEGPGGFLAPKAAVGDGALPLEESAKSVSLPIPPPVLQPPAGQKSVGFDALDAADALVMLDGTDDQPSQSSDETAAPVIDESSFLPPEEDELDMDALVIDTPAPSPQPAESPPAEDDGIVPILGAVVEVPAEPEPHAAPAPIEASADAALPAPSAPPERAPAPRRSTAPRKGARSAGSFVLLGGWFSDRPRVRVVVGFLAALMLASLLPICHARSVRTSRIEELRIDLATAKAHGAAVAGNRTPAEISADISSLQTRHTIYALAMWCALMGLFLFLWFRFT